MNMTYRSKELELFSGTMIEDIVGSEDQVTG